MIKPVGAPDRLAVLTVSNAVAPTRSGALSSSGTATTASTSIDTEALVIFHSLPAGSTAELAHSVATWAAATKAATAVFAVARNAAPGGPGHSRTATIHSQAPDAGPVAVAKQGQTALFVLADAGAAAVKASDYAGPLWAGPS